ncbi:helix-turn-helix domain-containing protein [Candidatus Mycobacterium methanotrophicum]|uniref:helix-turn-helix domain-containing protein n=1 Tax=Candidatus Mycobacterium methanotrophicum TaxID=2943498 RepID=UPI002107BB3F|nr:helix-turn-helix domain-containing protein [Candidatus Mycobacterium methanotrophicum]
MDCAARGEEKTALAKEFGISRKTVYAYFRAATSLGCRGGNRPRQCRFNRRMNRQQRTQSPGG